MDTDPKAWCWTLPKREIWHPPSIADQPLMKYEVVGGFWDIPCCHWWRWSPTLRYGDCHNIPIMDTGISLRKNMRMLHRDRRQPCMIHMGFAAQARERLAKNRYYAARGEAVDPKRAWYVRSRACFATWKPGDALPDGAGIIPYTGPVPEVLR